MRSIVCRGDLDAVDLEHANPAAADPAQVVEGQRREAEAVILEVELDPCACPAQGRRCLPT